MSTRTRSWLLLGLAALLLAVLVWQRTSDTTGTTTGTGSGGGAPGSSRSAHSGEIAEADLPAEARETLRLIDAGGPFPYSEDGGVFQNRERRLPQQPRGYYREYTVPTPGEGDRGARRIVTGSGGEYYWTQDHYRSFHPIAREGR